MTGALIYALLCRILEQLWHSGHEGPQEMVTGDALTRRVCCYGKSNVHGGGTGGPGVSLLLLG